MGDEADLLSILGANFSAGFVAGSLAAGATCPLDVAKTRRQIEVFLFRMKLYAFVWFAGIYTCIDFLLGYFLLIS